MDKDGSESPAKKEPSHFPTFTWLVEQNILIQDSLLFFWQEETRHVFEVKLYCIMDLRVKKIPNISDWNHSDNDPLPRVHLYEDQSCMPRSMITPFAARDHRHLIISSWSCLSVACSVVTASFLWDKDLIKPSLNSEEVLPLIKVKGVLS